MIFNFFTYMKTHNFKYCIKKKKKKYFTGSNIFIAFLKECSVLAHAPKLPVDTLKKLDFKLCVCVHVRFFTHTYFDTYLFNDKIYCPGSSIIEFYLA